MFTMHQLAQQYLEDFEYRFDEFLDGTQLPDHGAAAWTVEVADLKKTMVRPGILAYTGNITRTSAGVRIPVPRVPDTVPLAEWTNTRLRDLVTAHATQLLARRGRAPLC